MQYKLPYHKFHTSRSCDCLFHQKSNALWQRILFSMWGKWSVEIHLDKNGRSLFSWKIFLLQAIDVWMFVGQFFIVVSLLLGALIYHLLLKEEKGADQRRCLISAKKILITTRLTLPIGYCVFNIIYWTVHLTIWESAKRLWIYPAYVRNKNRAQFCIMWVGV